MAQAKNSKNPMRRLQDDIKNRSFASCYLLYGTESYLIRQYRQNLVSALVPEGDSMNLSTFTGSSFDEQEILSLAETMPFFNDYRVIVLEDSGLFRTKSETLTDYLARIPETTILIFTEYPSGDPRNPEKMTVRSVDKRGRFYKAVSKYGFCAQLDTPSANDLVRWVSDRIKKENKQVSDHTVRLFLSRSTQEMNQIRNDLEKLLSYTIDQDRITDADVEAVCSAHPEDHIFQMIDAISAKDRKKAFCLYDDLAALRTPPPRIMYLISDQYAKLLHVRELKDQGMSLPMITEETGLRSFAAEKYDRICRRYTADELADCLRRCVEAEEAFKTGQISDRMSLELLITELSM